MDEEVKEEVIPETPPIPGVPEGEGKPEEASNQVPDTAPVPVAVGPVPKWNPKKAYMLIRGKDLDIWIQDGNKFIGGKYVGKAE